MQEDVEVFAGELKHQKTSLNLIFLTIWDLLFKKYKNYQLSA